MTRGATLSINTYASFIYSIFNLFDTNKGYYLENYIIRLGKIVLKFIPFVGDIKKYFKLYYNHVGLHLYALLSVILITSLLDGLGFTLFIPLLDIGTENLQTDSNVQKYFDNFFNFFGIKKELSIVLALITGIFVLKGVVKFADGYYRASLLKTLIIKIRTEIVRKYSKATFDFYTNSSNGYWNNILILESKKMVAAFTVFARVLANIASSIIFLILSFFINAEMTIAGFVAGSLFFLLMTRIRKITQIQSKTLIKHHTRLQEFLTQIIHNFKYLKATNRFEKLLIQTTKSTTLVADTQKNLTLFRSLSESLSEPFIVIILSTLIYYQTIYISKSLSEILVSLFLLNKVIKYIMTFQNSWQVFLSMIGSIEETIKGLDELSNNKENLTGTTIRDFDNKIQLKNVSHQYGDIKALDKINIEICKNTTVAFVGHSGSGKSTIVNIISGLLSPTSGKVLIDENDLSQLNLSSVRDLIGYVTQESVIFQDSIVNNITCWDNKNNDQLENSIKMANAEEFISKLKDGTDTLLGDNGINLSGGQRQRISIARELYKQPKLLILDEATSALDSKSEEMVRKSIDSIKGQLTVLVVAHRISTVKNADCIYVLENGKIVEFGSFHDLLKNDNPVFQELYNLQDATEH